MSIKLEQLKNRQAEIEAFFEGMKNSKGKGVPGIALRKWIVDSVTHFEEVGVSVNLIDLFIQRCDYQVDKRGRISHGIFEYRTFKRGYILKDRGKTDDASPFIVPIQVVLSVSRMLVDRYEEEERIIPGSLINLFNTEKHQAIKLALESVEANYQTQDAPGMLGPLITATELICKTIPELENEKNIGGCFGKLNGTKGLYEKYYINKEVVWALNNARIIRNEEIVHAKSGHNGTVSMYEMVGYTHLLVLFTDSLFASRQKDQ